MERAEVIIFWLSLVFAGVASLFYLRLFVLKTGQQLYEKLATASSLLSLISLFLVILIQWARTGLHPFTGPFSAKVFYAFSIILVYTVFEAIYAKRVPRIKAVGVLVFPAVVLLMLVAWSQFEATATLSPELRSFRVFVHVSSAILAYGSYTLGTIFAIVYLAQERQLKSKKGLPLSSQRLPSLETAETSTHRALGVGLVFTVVLLLTGMFTAQLVWGKMWDWSEPREVAALVMLIAYGAYFLVRDILGWKGRRSSYVALLAFLVAIFTYLTPVFFNSLHSWGRGF